MIYIDPSFPDLGDLDDDQLVDYNYFGCFRPQPQAPSPRPLSYQVPFGDSFGFTTLEDCFGFCANLGFPYAGVDGTPNLFVTALVQR